MLRTRAGISQQIDCATAAARSAPLSAYLVCNVEYSHLPNSARTELLHEDETSRYFAVRYCIHFSDYTHSWLQTEMRSWSVTVVVCLLCLVWRYRLRLCWSAYRRGGLLSPPLGGEMATSSGGNLNRLEATTRVVQPGSVRSCWASYFKKNNVLLVTFILN